jgi:hypothetical protein
MRRNADMRRSGSGNGPHGKQYHTRLTVEPNLSVRWRYFGCNDRSSSPEAINRSGASRVRFDASWHCTRRRIARSANNDKTDMQRGQISDEKIRMKPRVVFASRHCFQQLDECIDYDAEFIDLESVLAGKEVQTTCFP